MRVGIVNDQPLAREVLRSVIISVPGYSVAWTANDGLEAVAKTKADKPDVVLMDLIMPNMDGVEATGRIMKESPCPVILVTSSTTANFSQVHRAMTLGGLDAVNTPTLGPGGKLLETEPLLAKLAKVAQKRLVPVIPKIATPNMTDSQAVRILDLPRSLPVVAVGVSTGGPVALGTFLNGLPAKFPGAVLVSLHIDPSAVPNLVQSLQKKTSLRIFPVTAPTFPDVGGIYIACSDDHMIVTPSGRLVYTNDPKDYPYRPSVNALFSSLAANWKIPGVAVILTGMGDDGAKGMLALKQNGWHTIAQDESTSVVYGMPQAAMKTGAATQSLPVEHIAGAVISRIKPVTS